MDKESFSQFYDKYLDKIFRFIYFRVDNEENAQDLTARVFLNFWKKVNQKKSKKAVINNPVAFIYQSARHLLIDYYRQKPKRIISLDRLPAEITDGELLKEKSFVQEVETNLEMSLVKKALKEIKKEYAEIVILYYLNDLSIQELSQIFHKREGTIRVMLHRAIEALKKRLS